MTYAEILHTSYYYKNLPIDKKLKNSVMRIFFYSLKRYFLFLSKNGITEFFDNSSFDYSCLKENVQLIKNGGHRAFFPAMAANRPYSEKINTCVFP